MDKSPRWLDMPKDMTVSKVGEHTLSVWITGHDKRWFTVILAAVADGRKLNAFVVFKGVWAIAELERVQGVVAGMNKNGWMIAELMIKWLVMIWGWLRFKIHLLD